MKKPNTPLTPKQKVAVLNFALDTVDTMHGSVTGSDEHKAEVLKCACGYGITMRGLRAMRREAYVAIQKTKTKAVKR